MLLIALLKENMNSLVVSGSLSSLWEVEFEGAKLVLVQVPFL